MRCAYRDHTHATAAAPAMPSAAPSTRWTVSRSCISSSAVSMPSRLTISSVKRNTPANAAAPGRTLDIEGRLQSSSVRPGAAAFAGVFLFTLLMVSREGIETALLLMQLRETVHLVLGAALGIAGAAAVAWVWSRYGHRINLALFSQATAIFLLVFVVQLVIRGTHEMSEQQFLPYSDAIHTATESWGPDSAFGHLLTYLLVILPLGWVALKALVSRRPVFQPAASVPQAPMAPGAAAPRSATR